MAAIFGLVEGGGVDDVWPSSTGEIVLLRNDGRSGDESDTKLITKSSAIFIDL